MLRTVLVVSVVLLSTVSIGCNSASDAELSEEALMENAKAIAQSHIILDGHIDVPYRLLEEMENVAETTAKGDFDYPRAETGGLNAPFMSIYLPARYQETPGASKKHAERLISMMDSVIAKNPDRFSKALTPDDVRKNFAERIISFPYGMENGSGIEDDLANLEYFFNKGIRYITLTHGLKNLICDSSYDLENQDWNGLSPFGEKVIAEMNRLGIMIDISHVSDSTFYQALELSKAPAICSHSSCRNFTPGFERNVNDDMLKALAAKGGVIQINFGSAFLTEKANAYREPLQAYLTKFMAEHNISDRDDPRVAEEEKEYRIVNPYPFATVNDVVAHIEHVIKLVGIDHVGLGSDYDGVGDSLPIGLKSVTDYPNLIYHLLEKGYSEEDIDKILSANVLRVWQQVTDIAAGTN